MDQLNLHQDRLFPSDPTQRNIARRLYAEVRGLPIVSPHGHTDPQWFADNAPFPDPATLLVIPDHYVYRMLYSQGVALESLGVSEDGWRTGRTGFAEDLALARSPQHWHLFRGTPTQMWFNHVLHEVFGIRETLTPESADSIYDRIADCLSRPEFLPRAWYERFNIEVLSTTESPLDPLMHHRKLRDSGWKGRVVPTYRPDPVVDPEFDGFAKHVRRLGEITGEDTTPGPAICGPYRIAAVFRLAGRDGHRSRPHLRPDLRSSAFPVRGFAGQSSERRKSRRPKPGIPRPDADRNGAAEHRGRVGDADPPRGARNHNPSVFSAFGLDKGATFHGAPITCTT